ncbi:MAG: peptide chain release factor N(5)-glutamine methyltransferase [Verrucomicrobiota bacterium]
MTILEVINKTTPFFEKNGIESPRLNIELLLAHVLQKKRLQLYMEFEREVDEKTLEVLREMVKRRVASEPLQYIVGETEFCGLKLAVDRRVLIPRPETELLVEIVAARKPSVVVDVGTGSGCIALSLAKKLPAAEIMAIDASAEALVVALANAKRHDLEKNVRFVHGDLLSSLPDGFTCDAIVSNPPYIASGELAKLPKEVKDFEPVSALIAGDDGIEIIRRLVMSAKRFLSPLGFVALEMGAGQRPAVEAIFVSADFTVAQVEKDLQGHERVIVAVPKL